MIKDKNFAVIAEIGVNHNGKIELAKKMISKAKLAGANFAKFQIFKSELLVSKKAKLAKYQKKNLKYKNNSQFNLLKKLELNYKQLSELKQYCKKKKIKFLLSVFDTTSLDFALKNLNEKIIKIPSGEINNFELLKKINIKKVKVLLSTGMSNMKEIVDAVNILAKKKIYMKDNKNYKIIDKKVFEKIKKNLVIMHCVTDYPVDYRYANLNAIKTLKENLKLKIGYSDHTNGILAPIIAKQLGAVLIEKHFTLNKNFQGPDHKASLDFFEFCLMCESLKNINLVYGNGLKKIQKCEIGNSKVARKSIVVTKKIKIGDKFSLKNLGFKRPGYGIKPSEISKFLGKKSKRTYKIDDLLIK